MIEFETFEAEWREDSSGAWVSFKVHDKETAFNTCKMLLDSKAYQITIKEKKPVRSLDANAYFHLLVNRIAVVTSQSDEDVKIDLVCKYGTLAKDKDDKWLAAKLPEYIDPSSIYPYTKLYKTVEENGGIWNCYLFYKRTHTMNSKEMARLIDGTVNEAKELGIKTELPSDIKFVEV